MRVVVSPAQLNINPILGRNGSIIVVLVIVQERGLADLPLIRGKEQNVSTRGVHFVALSGMNCFFLDCVDLQGV